MSIAACTDLSLVLATPPVASFLRSLELRSRRKPLRLLSFLARRFARGVAVPTKHAPNFAVSVDSAQPFEAPFERSGPVRLEHQTLRLETAKQRS